MDDDNDEVRVKGGGASCVAIEEIMERSRGSDDNITASRNVLIQEQVKGAFPRLWYSLILSFPPPDTRQGHVEVVFDLFSVSEDANTCVMGLTCESKHLITCDSVILWDAVLLTTSSVDIASSIVFVSFL